MSKHCEAGRCRHLPIADHRAGIEIISICEIYGSVRPELEHAFSEREALLFGAGHV